MIKETLIKFTVELRDEEGHLLDKKTVLGTKGKKIPLTLLKTPELSDDELKEIPETFPEQDNTITFIKDKKDFNTEEVSIVNMSKNKKPTNKKKKFALIGAGVATLVTMTTLLSKKKKGNKKKKEGE